MVGLNTSEGETDTESFMPLVFLVQLSMQTMRKH